MVIVGVDPGPVTHGAVIYDSVTRRVLWSDKSADWMSIMDESEAHEVERAVIERPAAMGGLGTGKVGHMLDTAWEGGRMVANFQLAGIPTHELTRRQVLRELGVMSGTGSADSRVRRACIADHQTPGGPLAVGYKATPGPLYGVSSHAWQALGAVLAWLESQR